MSSVAILETLSTSNEAVHSSRNNERYVVAAREDYEVDNFQSFLLLGHNGTGWHMGGEPSWDYTKQGAGTIQQAARASSDSGFFVRRSDEGSISDMNDRFYWTVAKVNPLPVNGHYYRVLPVGGAEARLLQYFDADHISDRFVAHNPWNIVYGGTGPWVYGRDSQGNVRDLSIVEVELDESSSLLPEAAEWRLANRPTSVESSVIEPAAGTGPEQALGLALIVGNSEPQLRPEIEAGKIYVAWNRSSPNGRVDIVTRRYGSRLSSIGTLSRNDDGSYLRLDNHGRNLWDDEYDWVEAVMPTISASPATDTDKLAQLRTQLSERMTAFDSFNSDLNGLAREHDWCSEYEDTVTPYGLKSREALTKNWDLVIYADVTIVDGSPSSDIDRTLSNDWGIDGFESSNIKVSGSMRVTIIRSAETSDEAYENLDDDDVASAIGDQFSVDVSVNNYSLDSAEESDD